MGEIGAPEQLTLIRDFAIIMAVAGAALVLFRRLGQPPVLGYLLAGFLIGPFTLPSPPVRDPEAIRLLADIGLVLLLFALGLEFGWERIRQIGLRVVFIGVIEIALKYSVPWVREACHPIPVFPTVLITLLGINPVLFWFSGNQEVNVFRGFRHPAVINLESGMLQMPLQLSTGQEINIGRESQHSSQGSDWFQIGAGILKAGGVANEYSARFQHA